MLSESPSLLPSLAIGNVPFPTYEAVITNSLHSNYLLFVERIKCNIPLVDDHKHLPSICKIFVLFFMLNVKNDRLDVFSLRRHAHGPLAKHLMHMVHFSGNTSGVSKSSSDWLNYTGFPGEVCVVFFNLETKRP